MAFVHIIRQGVVTPNLAPKWSFLSALYSASTRNFSDQGSSSSDWGKPTTEINKDSFKSQLIQKHLFPSDEEASALKELFPDPKKVVDDLFEPFTKVEEKLAPTLEVKRHLRDTVFKSHLTLKWPASVNVSGAHTDEDTAVQNAYLRACELFWNMGLIELSECGTRAYTTEHVIKILEDFASKQSHTEYDSSNFRVINLLQQDRDELLSWKSSLQVYWPVCFTVSSQSSCLDLAYYQSCLKTAMKFKAFGYLNQNNQLKQGLLLALQRYDKINCHQQVRQITDPDYEIYVDASAVGMGAYLISKEEEKIRWISDRWIQSRIKFNPRADSNLCEFYALVTAIYTWKHKFGDKKIICYCDNLFVVNAINSGIYSTRISLRSRSYESLFILMMKVCHRYNITLVGVHVPRLQNVAADLLSRCDVDSFKRIVPTAYENPKKSKKLWFCSFNKHLKDDKTDSDDGNGKKGNSR